MLSCTIHTLSTDEELPSRSEVPTNSLPHLQGVLESGCRNTSPWMAGTIQRAPKAPWQSEGSGHGSHIQHDTQLP